MGHYHCINREDPEQQKQPCKIKHHDEQHVCACIRLEVEWKKRHLSECIQCNQKTLCDID